MTASRDPSATDADHVSDRFSVSRILFATDGSPGAEAAAAHAVELADRTGAVLHVLAVVEGERVASFASEGMRRQVRTRAAVEGEEAAATAARRATAAGVHALTAVEEGDPAAVVAAFAADVDAEVVVVGTRGRTGDERFALGSVAEELLDRVASAVLAVPIDDDDAGAVTPSYRRLLLATDGEATTRRATAAALSLAAAYGADVDALSVVDERVGRTPDARASLDASARETVERVAMEGASVGLSVAPRVETGVPAARILDVADAGTDLVVVGARRPTDAETRPLGSVSRRVVRGSPVPVLVVRGETDGAAAKRGDE
ncbi:Nucleotide-binding universal stress protein, UspA family [Halogeometricum rufum]|uniref:Nucleotide-binding universal stress protein, UspA family n=1 Tax=Halogeometricum rufum TaxID=553469 RepID=A0A1I6HKA4_9EURY|nr:universal stress protein [Halogeometricum rufum]SFR54730.1 Nucleotide-binding universal stress protein, UspA family [Halogeometricum rufum]